MSKMSVIFLYFVFNYLLQFSKTNSSSQPKNLLFTADFKDSEEFIFRATDDYIRLSVAKDRSILGRSSFPTCLAVGCTKTTLICEQKKGFMITTFRSVNDTRQAYFKSTLVADDIVLTVNCRESHTACCFAGTKNLNAVAMPAVRPTAPLLPKPVNKPLRPTILLTPLRPNPAVKPLVPPKVRPTILLTPLKHYLPTNSTPKPPNSYYPPVVEPTTKPYASPLPAKQEVPQLGAYSPHSIPLEELPSNEEIKFITDLRSNPILKSNKQKSEMRTNPEPSPNEKTKLSIEVPASLSSPVAVELHQTKVEAPLPPEKYKTTTTTAAPPTTTTPPTTTMRPLSPNRPIKVYLFSNICMGFLGGAGFVDCNG